MFLEKLFLSLLLLLTTNSFAESLIDPSVTATFNYYEDNLAEVEDIKLDEIEKNKKECEYRLYKIFEKRLDHKCMRIVKSNAYKVAYDQYKSEKVETLSTTSEEGRKEIFARAKKDEDIRSSIDLIHEVVTDEQVKDRISDYKEILDGKRARVYFTRDINLMGFNYLNASANDLSSEKIEVVVFKDASETDVAQRVLMNLGYAVVLDGNHFFAKVTVVREHVLSKLDQAIEDVISHKKRESEADVNEQDALENIINDFSSLEEKSEVETRFI